MRHGFQQKLKSEVRASSQRRSPSRHKCLHTLRTRNHGRTPPEKEKKNSDLPPHTTSVDTSGKHRPEPKHVGATIAKKKRETRHNAHYPDTHRNTGEVCIILRNGPRYSLAWLTGFHKRARQNRHTRRPGPPARAPTRAHKHGSKFLFPRQEWYKHPGVVNEPPDPKLLTFCDHGP